MTAAVPASTPAAPARHIAADRLYWSVIPQGAHLREGVRRFRFEQVLPVPVESLHTATAITAHGDAVLIGIDRDQLAADLARLGGSSDDTWRLIPDALPAHVLSAGIDADIATRLNLLTGAYEPAARRRLRHLAVAVPIVAMVLTAVLMVIGTQRRQNALQQHAAEVRHATETMITAALPPSASGLDPQVRLTMEVRRLSQARHGQADLDRYQDVAASLAACLKRWPADLRTRVETLTATPQRIVVRGHVANLADAERLAHALDGGELGSVRWRAEPVQATQSPTGADYTVNLLPLAPVSR
ncbi:MAG: hypothetical protein H0V44_16985 [Planctomycetes bacterium]|nr:hypothetical protein [Planctomycetota bacterium]